MTYARKSPRRRCEVRAADDATTSEPQYTRIEYGPEGEPPIAWDPWPLPDFVRGDQTDEQWALIVAERQYQRELFGIIRALYQRVATDRGMPAACARRACRRTRACCGRRPFPGGFSVAELLPPCVPMDDEHFFGMRDEARPIVLRFAGAGAEAGRPGWSNR